MTFGPPEFEYLVSKLASVFEEGYRFTTTRLELSLTNLSPEVAVNYTLSQFQDFGPNDLLLFYYMGHGNIRLDNMRFLIHADGL